jgi:signal transduction histidine kinase/DNA-binding response OmpR family regulator
MKSLFTLAFVVAAHCLYAQPAPPQRKIDSLEAQLEEKITDHQKALTLGALAGLYININIDSSSRLIEEAASLYNPPERDTAVVRLLYNYTEALQSHRKRDLQYVYLLKARRIAEKFASPSKLKRAILSELSDYYHDQHHLDSTLFYDQQALKNAVDTLERIIDLKRVGLSHNDMGNTVTALECYLGALRLLEKFEHPRQKAAVLNNLGILYEDDGDNAKAEEYYQEAMKIHKEMNNADGIVRVLLNLGIVYDHEDEHKKALDCFAEAEALLKQNPSLPPFRTTVLHLNTGAALDHAGRFAESLPRFYKAMEGFKEVNDYYGIALAHRHIGEALYDLERYAEAEKNEVLTLKLAKEHGYSELEKQAYFDLFRIYEKTGQYKKGFEYQGRYLHIQDSLSSRERRSKLGLLEKEYELSHKENENQKLVQENEIQKIQASADQTTRTALGTTLGVFILLAVMTAVGYYRTKAKNNLLAAQKAKIEASNELITLQSQQLEEAAKAKSRFFANVSHELRTPVTLINGMLEMMQEHAAASKSNEMMDIALSNSRRLHSLVNEVLDLSRLEASKTVLQKKNIKLLPLLNRMIYAFESLLVKKDIELRYDATDLEGVHLDLDEDKFEKIINNLMYNAMKFNRDGGWIKVEGTLSDGKDAIVVRISDSGVGIAESDLVHIFERFYQSNSTVSKNAQGIGIGLSLVKEFTALHGGEVSVASKVNEGSVFTVHIPIRHETLPEFAGDAAADEIAVADGFSFEGYDKPPVVLVAEDNEEMRFYLKEIFENKVTIHEAAHGREALKWLKTNSPDLIISDVMMPEMDGYEFLQQLKSNETQKNIPVIMLTARASEEDLLHGLSLGVDDYIIKPFNAKELKIRVRNLLMNQVTRRQWKSKPVEKDEQPEVVTEDKIFLQKAEEFVTLRAGDPTLGIPDLADHLSLSERQLYRRCGLLTGMTPAQLIKDIRLKIAFRLLSERKVTKISALATEVGFDNSAYFSRQFLERFGKKPIELL